MKNSARFFCNKECEYYPCHEYDGELNCLFCYCPLYSLPACPGTWEMTGSGEKKIKSCMNCTFPHKPENYDTVMEILKRNM